MSNMKKKHRGAQRAPAPSAPAPDRTRGTAGLIAAVAVVLVAGAVVVTTGLNKGRSSSPLQPTAEEAEYIGRFLPAGYRAPSVAGEQSYDSAVEMTEVAATSTDMQFTLPLTQVTDARITMSTYEGVGGPLPIITYVKPSGTLFVGISFCPPCEGEWQTIASDGTLTCNACGTKRDLETGAGISGTCRLYPLDELPVTVEGDTISIDRAVLDSWTPQPLDRDVG